MLLSLIAVGAIIAPDRTSHHYPFQLIRRHHGIAITSHRPKGYLPRPRVRPKLHTKGVWLEVERSDHVSFMYRNGQIKAIRLASVGVDHVHPTPPGWHRIVEIKTWPSWRPPKKEWPKLRRYFASQGFHFPASGVVPSGHPLNALGAYSMRLDSFSSPILIHGTNTPWTIGTSCTLGCVQFGNGDIAQFVEQGLHVGSWVYID